MEIKAKSFNLSSRLKKTCWVLLLVSVLTLVCCTILALRYHNQMPEFEYSIFSFINKLPDSLTTMAIILTTMLGSVWAFVAISVITTMLRAYRLAWWISFSVFITYGIVAVLKFVIDRPRPQGLIGDAIIRTSESSSGFPSAHTALATILSLTLFFYLPKGWRWIIIVFWIGITAWTRLYLGVHSPLDIIGGLVIGVGVFASVRLLPQKLQIMLCLRNKPKATVKNKLP